MSAKHSPYRLHRQPEDVRSGEFSHSIFNAQDDVVVFLGDMPGREDFPKEIVDALNEIATLREQRDELVAALKKAKSIIECERMGERDLMYGPGENIFKSDIAAIDAALAKAGV